MMPVNTGLTLTLPTSGCTERQHQPFAEVVTIADIKDEVELLPSLQKPKKVCLPTERHCLGLVGSCWFSLYVCFPSQSMRSFLSLSCAFVNLIKIAKGLSDNIVGMNNNKHQP